MTYVVWFMSGIHNRITNTAALKTKEETFQKCSFNRRWLWNPKLLREMKTLNNTIVLAAVKAGVNQYCQIFYSKFILHFLIVISVILDHRSLRLRVRKRVRYIFKNWLIIDKAGNPWTIPLCSRFEKIRHENFSFAGIYFPYYKAK